MERPLRFFSAVPLLAGVLLVGSACTTAPAERAEAIRAESPLSRAVFLNVDPGDLEDPAGWVETLVRRCRELNVAAAVWHEEEREQEADMVVTVRLSRKPRAGAALPPDAPPSAAGEAEEENAPPGPRPEEPEVLPEGAMLDFLAWSSLPGVAWWIADVSVDPGIAGTVEWSLRSGRAPGGPRDSRPLSVPKLLTSLRDRSPLLSWPTLGALVLPPFVFSSHDEEHLSARIRDRLQEEVAMQTARIIKKDCRDSLLAEEFLHNLALNPQSLVLQYDVEPDVGRVEVRLNSSSSDPVDKDEIQVNDPGLRGRTRPLRKVLSGLQHGGLTGEQLLRVEAISSDLERGRRSYSVPVRVPQAALDHGGPP